MEWFKHALILFIIAFGVVQCFFGYRAFKGVLVVIGFALGYLVCHEFVMAVLGHKYAAFFISLAAGVMCGALIVHLYLVGVFIAAALFGGTFALQMYAVSQQHPEPAMLFIVAVLSGVAALFFQKVVIVIVTAISGGWAIVGGVAWYLTGTLDPSRFNSYAPFFQRNETATIWVAIAWAGLVIAGATYQYRVRGVTAPREAAAMPPP